MVDAEVFRKAGCKYLGRLYSEMDCQAFVEKALADSGIRMDLKGSNAWYRKMTWVGSPEECKSKFGYIPKGAFLFIHAFDGGEEARGYHDGKGNASHIGIDTGLTGHEMVAIAWEAKTQGASRWNYGDGAIHSSSSRGHVATTNFKGKAISGGWNKIGLWKSISYDEKVNKILNGESPEPEPSGKTAVVTASSGSTVNMRTSPSKSALIITRVPIGSTVEIIQVQGDWSKLKYQSNTGWMMNEFLKSSTDTSYTVTIPDLTKDQAEELKKQYPNAVIQCY